MKQPREWWIIGSIGSDIWMADSSDNPYKGSFEPIRVIEKQDDDTFWNHGTEPIFISHKIIPDPYGGQGKLDQRIIIAPGDGINISVLGLKRGKPL